jgi:hypothetical protein
MEQIRLLSRTFFTRLFESELMPEGLPQVQLVLWGALLAATPTSWMSMMVTERYQRLAFTQPLALEFAADRMVLVTLSMMAIGVVGLIIWDGVFPDRRDVRILGPLPVRGWRFVVARLAALGRVYLIFAAPLCLLQSIVFPMVVAGYGDPVPRWHGILAHLLTVLMAYTFVFTSLIAIQCLLLLSFGRRAAQHVSVAFQLLFAVGIVQLIVFLPDLGRLLREGGRAHEGLSAVSALPPTWFFGLYELSTVGLYWASYGVLSRRALEGPLPRPRRKKGEHLAGVLRLLPAPRFNAPLRAAIRQFSIRTITRSRYHRMMLAIYAGVALAIIFSSWISVAVRDGGIRQWRPGVPMLSMPLIFQFLMLIGIRVVIAVPSEPRARWVFRVAEPADRVAAITGARDAMMVLVVAPTAAFALAQGLIFWSVPAALSHTAFCWVIGRLFADLLLMRTDKLPFACTYFPGKSRVFTLWPLYVMAFFLYTLLLAALDLALIGYPRGWVWFGLVAACLIALVAFAHRRVLSTATGLRFEEEDPDLMFQGFNLSEGMAAAPRPPASAGIAEHGPKTAER